MGIVAQGKKIILKFHPIYFPTALQRTNQKADTSSIILSKNSLNDTIYACPESEIFKHLH